MKPLPFLRAALLCGAVLLGAGAASAQDRLAAEIGALINGPDYKHAHWGMLILDLETGKVVFEHNADKLFAPASVTKLFSCAAALDALGSDFRFRTPVHRRGEIDAAGVLAGDLILVASGDPSLGGRGDLDGPVLFKDNDHTYANGNMSAQLTEADPLAGLNELARQVAAAGIKRVRGEVLIDERLFDKAEGTGSGPSRLTPIMVNDNLIDFLVTAGAKAGMPATVAVRPETAAWRVDAQVETVEAGLPGEVRISALPGRITVRGRVPAGLRPLVRVFEVDDAASFSRSLFIEALRRAGVLVDASPLTANRAELLPAWSAYEKLPKPAELASPPLSQSIRLILKVSHNLHASTLPLLLAAKSGKRTLEDGLRIQRDHLRKLGVDTDAVSFGGGAGGSRADFVTPRAAVQLLSAMSKRPDFAAYQVSLPVLGLDGTLATSVGADSPAKGKVRAKTGTLFWFNALNGRWLLLSKALSGYMNTAGGKTYAFAFFVNGTHLNAPGETAREGRALGKLCEIVHRNR